MFSANTSQVAGAAALYVEDLFSVYTRTGTGASQTITTGIAADLVVTKGRSGATDWAWYDTARGATYDLVSNSTAAQTTQAQGLTAFGSTGHTWGTLAKVNTNAATYVDFAWKESARFFKKLTVSHTNGSANTVDLSSLGTVGMVAVKRTDSTSDWLVWHRSLTAGNLTYLNLVNVQTADTSLSVSGTTLTIAAALATGTYVVYAWAHDTASDGIIQCGSFTTDGSSNIPTTTLGWEPQWVTIKAVSTTGDWITTDSMIGFTANQIGMTYLLANASNAAAGPAAGFQPLATGFFSSGVNFGASTTYIYLAIRRSPMKAPTSGTQVYNAIATTPNGGVQVITGSGFPPDLVISQVRPAGYGNGWEDRLRGAGKNLTSGGNQAPDTPTSAEVGYPSTVTSFDMNGVTLGADPNTYTWNGGSFGGVKWFFRRYPGVFDEVCDTGTGAAHAINHNLTVPPELMIRKGRSGATQWEVYSAAIANTEKLVLDSTAAKATDTTAWNSTTPTATTFTVGTGANVNTNAATYVTYLMASLAGVSKVGSYTGNGSSQTINCGFAAGARFALIKRTDSTGDWYVWDSTRGIVAANDPRLSLNTTAAEVTTDDSVDPDSSGFIVNQVAATNINVTAATYIFLAFT